MSDVEIEALKPFNRTPQGDPCDVGDRFTVGATRADELERLKLARRVAAAPKPENKMRQEPAAKQPPAPPARRTRPNKG
ncbi:hypothetical protein [Jiella sonneratiae]|uniref:Uncharacterized protein n=1 Tax=Jiella sonneratiae TaxID=2816856 RepID=A0ABS3J3H2_9HYPH|nr:hypothetical protein [Jiella sonneratiae]MBO0904221.1 hypothetical protein [Jiella sonneratiae]